MSTTVPTHFIKRDAIVADAESFCILGFAHPTKHRASVDFFTQQFEHLTFVEATETTHSFKFQTVAVGLERLAFKSGRVDVHLSGQRVSVAREHHTQHVHRAFCGGCLAKFGARRSVATTSIFQTQQLAQVTASTKVHSIATFDAGGVFNDVIESLHEVRNVTLKILTRLQTNLASDLFGVTFVLVIKTLQIASIADLKCAASFAQTQTDTTILKLLPDGFQPGRSIVGLVQISAKFYSILDMNRHRTRTSSVLFKLNVTTM